MIFGSVCSGIEAASEAWNPLGWKAAWFSEIEPFPSAVLKHHHPEVPNLGDMTKIQDSEVFNGADIDVLVGGTPCQSFSVAGLRKGMADPRGNLALHFLALLDRKRPRWVVWENVPGVLSSWSDAEDRPATADDYAAAGQEDPGDGRRGTVVTQSNDFDTFTSGLRELGYGLAWRVLDAQFAGVPQRRRRVFVVGYLGDWRPAAAVLFERHGLCGHSAPSRATRQGNTSGTQEGAGSCYRWQNEKEGLVEDEVTATLRARAGSTYPRNIPGYVVPPVAGTLGANHGNIKAEDAWGNKLIVEPVEPIAFSSKDYGADAGETCPTLRAGGHDESHANGGCPPAVVYENHGQDSRVKECEVSPQINAKAGTGGGNLPLAITPAPAVVFKPSHFTRGKDGAPSETAPPLSADADKGDQDPIVFETRYARNGRGAPDTVCPPLKAQSGESGKGDAAPVVAFTQNSRSEVRELGGDGQIVGALAAQPGAQQQNYIAGTAVRRLTPRECERLQGFPDDYTDIPWKGKTAPDGPRYKALGNSMTVNVMEWIGKRIQAVEDAIKGR